MSKPLRIGIVCPYNIYRSGGVQEAVLAHQRELTKLGHKVIIIAPRARNLPENQLPHVLLVGQSAQISTMKTRFEVAVSMEANELEQIFTEHQFDILHVHEPWVPLIPRQLLNRSPAINLATFHAKMPDSPINRGLTLAIKPYTKSFFKNLHFLTAVSDVAAEHVRSVAPVPVKIIPNGIDLATYDPVLVDRYDDFDGKTIVYLGRLEKRKGANYLLRAYRELAKQDPKLRLLLAGEGAQRKSLEAYVAKYDLTNVTFLGFVDDATKLRLLKSADLFCSPALYGESFGIVLLEAMAMGAVTLAGSNPGYASVLVDRGRLSLADPRDQREFTHRLELLLYDEEVRTLWQEWAAEYVKQFDYPLLVKRYESIYQELLQQHGRA